MTTHRTRSIAFKRQVVQEYLAGETLHGLARRHNLSGSRDPLQPGAHSRGRARLTHSRAEGSVIHEYA